MNTDQAILITGAGGQIGSELNDALKKRYSTVIASDLNAKKGLIALDVMDKKRVREVLQDYKITQVYHLAAILSAKGEQHPKLAWEVNLNSGLALLELAEELKLDKVFWPSSIAVFGTETPKEKTPQNTITDPDTVYGITKLAGERWCSYYNKKRGVDVRSIRYPGLISYKTHPGGGTTDYAVEIFHQAIKHQKYTCFLGDSVRLPMMYMGDAIRATLELMDAPSESLSIHSAYNVSGMNFTPKELAAEIQGHMPNFEIAYAPDFREEIARSWPASIDDRQARKDWAWRPEFDMKKMVEIMLEGVRKTEFSL